MNERYPLIVGIPMFFLPTYTREHCGRIVSGWKDQLGILSHLDAGDPNVFLISTLYFNCVCSNINSLNIG